jgi:hypothetical protein
MRAHCSGNDSSVCVGTARALTSERVRSGHPLLKVPMMPSSRNRARSRSSPTLAPKTPRVRVELSVCAAVTNLAGGQLQPTYCGAVPRGHPGRAAVDVHAHQDQSSFRHLRGAGSASVRARLSLSEQCNCYSLLVCVTPGQAPLAWQSSRAISQQCIQYSASDGQSMKLE